MPAHCGTGKLLHGRAANARPGRLHRRPATAGLGGHPTDVAGPGRQRADFRSPDFRAGRRNHLSQTRRVTGSRRRTLTATSAIRTTPGGSCRSGCPVPCDTRWPFSRQIAAASTSSCDAIIHRHQPSAVAWTTPPASNARIGDEPCLATTVPVKSLPCRRPARA